MDPTRLGQVALKGWRAKVADAAAGPISSKTPLKPAQVRAAIGATFFALATLYVVTTARGIAQEARG